MRRKIFTLLVIALVLPVSYGFAQMGGGMAGGSMMTNGWGFGMMSGMAGAPVVGDDGTAYIVSHNPASTPGTTPTNNSFESKLVSVKTNGETASLTLKGMISRPVVVGNYLVATASVPDCGNFMVVGNYGNNALNRQSVLYILTLPFSSSTVPGALSMDGSYASVPVVAANHVYVTTTDFGNAMMQGSNMFNGMYGNYNYNSDGTAKSYLYIFNFDGTAPVKVELP